MSNDKISIDAKIIKGAIEKEARRQFRRLPKKERDKYFTKVLTADAQEYKKEIETLKRAKTTLKRQLAQEKERFENALASAVKDVASTIIQSVVKGLDEIGVDIILDGFAYSESCEYDDDYPSLSEVANSNMKIEIKDHSRLSRNGK